MFLADISYIDSGTTYVVVVVGMILTNDWDPDYKSFGFLAWPYTGTLLAWPND